MFKDWKQLILKTLGWMFLGAIVIAVVTVVSAVVWAFLCEVARG